MDNNTLIFSKDFTMSYTYLTTEELSQRIKYDSKTIRNQLKDAVFITSNHLEVEKSFLYGKRLKNSC